MMATINRRGSYQKVSGATRLLISQLIDKGKTNVEIAEILGVKRQTVHGIRKVLDSEGRRDLKRRGGSTSKLNDQQKEAIKNWIDDNITITLRELQTKLIEEFNISVYRQSVHTSKDLTTR